MNKKEKEDLSDAIGNGILRGFAWIIGAIAVSLIIITIVIVGITFYSNHQQQQCLKDGTCITATTGSIQSTTSNVWSCHDGCIFSEWAIYGEENNLTKPTTMYDSCASRCWKEYGGGEQ